MFIQVAVFCACLVAGQISGCLTRAIGLRGLLPICVVSIFSPNLSLEVGMIAFALGFIWSRITEDGAN